MNFGKIMASLVVLSATAACNSTTEEAPIIERPEVKVEDGKLTPELLFALGRVTDPQVSPDGSRILYGIGYESVEQNKSNRELWVINADGSNATRLTHTAASEQNAVWIDGGKKIAFLYREGDAMQIFTMNADGTDRRCVSKVEKGVDGFVLSPDETKVLFISQVKA
ncbi:MAG: TolB family protein, partial [Muribaculaceae bacterium]